MKRSLLYPQNLERVIDVVELYVAIDNDEVNVCCAITRLIYPYLLRFYVLFI